MAKPASSGAPGRQPSAMRRTRWTASIRRTRRTQVVDVLTDAGLTREALLDLGDDVGTSTNAQRAGDQFLAQHSSPLNAGALTIAEPILDIEAARALARRLPRGGGSD